MINKLDSHPQTIAHNHIMEKFLPPLLQGFSTTLQILPISILLRYNFCIN